MGTLITGRGVVKDLSNDSPEGVYEIEENENILIST